MLQTCSSIILIFLVWAISGFIVLAIARKFWPWLYEQWSVGSTEGRSIVSILALLLAILAPIIIGLLMRLIRDLFF
jgi:hypothetical protein